jgi:quinoprotein glucose dehydrogenase
MRYRNSLILGSSIISVIAISLLFLIVPYSEIKAKIKRIVLGEEAEIAAKRVKIEGNLQVSVWAAEPMLQNPVVFAFDKKGACYVVETNRLHTGVPDTRGHMHWLDDDIAARTVEDRVKMYHKEYPGKKPFTGFEGNSEVLRKIWDSQGKGVADQSSVFSDGYNQPADGIAAGVLPIKDDVYFACVPSLYKLKDTKGQNKADSKKVLSTGYGIHVQFVGHDLHGLKMGPDGRLYFSIGDRGFKVETKEGKTLNVPDCGAVLRCELDGSNLEVVHKGLRNPQEIAFDNLGNLFTYDNNSDSGDQARWVQIMEGGDSGWRCGFQYGTLMHHSGVAQGNRGPWNTEKFWCVPTAENTPPAFVVPAIKHFGNGPSGITFYPGLGLGDRYQDHFFAVDFTANVSNSIIWSLAVKPKGASFEVVDLHEFVKNAVPTDCEFGPDSAFYWCDWTGGWDMPKKGRIFKAVDPVASKNPAVEEARKILATGVQDLNADQLSKLLDHPHRDVRFEAQYELAARGTGVSALLNAAIESKNPQTRRHAIWGLGQFQRKNPDLKVGIAQFTKDTDATVRAQVAKVLGELGRETDAILPLLNDADLHVRREAVVAYGKRKPKSGDDYLPVFNFLKNNNANDGYMRHAAVQALATMTEQPCDLLSAFDSLKERDNSLDTVAVRMGVVLAQRKLQCHRLSRFLKDSDPAIVSEAARAIYDEEQMAAMEDLANAIELPNLPEPAIYRALAANYKLGIKPERVALFASQTNQKEHLREYAVKLLTDWVNPIRRDPITGLTQNLGSRDAKAISEAIKPHLTVLLSSKESIRSATIQAVAKLKIEGTGELLSKNVSDTTLNPKTRAECLFALEKLKAKELTAATEVAIQSPDAKLRAAGRVVRAKSDPQTAMKELPALLKDTQASFVEKQLTLGVMGTMDASQEIDESLEYWLDQLQQDKVPPEWKLDLIEAVQARLSSNKKLFTPLKEKIAAYEKTVRQRPTEDTIRNFRDVISGGDAERGREIFINNSAVYCQRCHKLDGQGGDVGPNITQIGKDKTREYLLESIVNPTAQIAKGYESIILRLDDGRTLTGVLRSKTDKEITIVDADGKVTVVQRDTVESEKPDKSAMPDDLHKKLSRRELRDVVEFLFSLK